MSTASARGTFTSSTPTRCGTLPSFRTTIDALEEKGCSVVLGGEYNGVNFAYLSTDTDLGLITEIFDAPPGLEQKPDAVYPP
jgi:hypothetical protein